MKNFLTSHGSDIHQNDTSGMAEIYESITIYRSRAVLLVAEDDSRGSYLGQWEMKTIFRWEEHKQVARRGVIAVLTRILFG